MGKESSRAVFSFGSETEEESGKEEGEMNFEKKSLDGYYFTTKGFYIFFIPVYVPYKKIYAMADAAGLKKKEAFGPILESGGVFGFGWIGVEVEKPSEARSDVKHFQGEFQMFEHRGPYKNLGQSYKKIMKGCPEKTEYYNLFLDDPEKIPAEQLRTQILFR